MKETNIEKYFTKKEKNVDINIRPLFINCIISIFSLCFLVGFLLFCHLLMVRRHWKNLIYNNVGGWLCICYSFTLFLFIYLLAL